MVYQPEDLLWGQYQVKRYLGSGGMAEVYQVTDSVGVNCAAKVIRDDHLRDIKIRQRFLQLFQDEIGIHTQLAHPHIVRCYNAFIEQEPPGMVLQYIDGESLRTIIRQLDKGVLPNPEVLRIVEQISTALTYMHEQGFCHCDLKPGNILQGSNRDYYLTDFGVSQPMGQSGVMKGTWYYMAPEQFEREAVTAQTDVYSFAITIYEMITGGYRPFTDRTDKSQNTGESRSDALREKHLYVDPPPPSHFNPDILPEVDKVIENALAKDPRDRYANTDALVNDLKQAFRPGVGKRIKNLSAADARSAMRPAQLVCTRGHYKGVRFPIEKRSILLGRSTFDCDIEIPEGMVSRRHVLLSWAGEAGPGGAFYLQDQGSTYKTRVNGRVTLACRLYHNDLIGIAGNNFRFEYLE